MTKLLIYIGEKEKFDVAKTVEAISSMSGTSRARSSEFIGAIFECTYAHDGVNTTIRLSPDAETITAESLGDEALAFALELQSLLPTDLSAIDMSYNFNVSLRDFKSLQHLKEAVSS